MFGRNSFKKQKTEEQQEKVDRTATTVLPGCRGKNESQKEESIKEIFSQSALQALFDLTAAKRQGNLIAQHLYGLKRQ